VLTAKDRSPLHRHSGRWNDCPTFLIDWYRRWLLVVSSMQLFVVAGGSSGHIPDLAHVGPWSRIVAVAGIRSLMAELVAI